MPFGCAGKRRGTGLSEQEVRHARSCSCRQPAIEADDRRHNRFGPRLRGGCNRFQDCLRVAAVTVDVGDQQRVDPIVTDQFSDSRGVFGRPGSERQQQWILCLAGRTDVQPSRRAGLGSEHRHTGGVAHDPDLPAARQWLALEQLGRLEQLLAAAKAHHPALMQHRVEHGIATQRRSGSRAGRYMSVLDAASLDHEDGLLACHALGDSHEPLRIAERLHVEHDRGRALVILAPLQ